jgi:hypothetical protein
VTTLAIAATGNPIVRLATGLTALALPRGLPFQVQDWEGYRDSVRLTCRDYVTLQHERELYVDGLIDECPGARPHRAATSPRDGWAATPSNWSFRSGHGGQARLR